MFKIINLPGGVRLIYQHLPYAKSVAAGIFIKSGSAYETGAFRGISHFIEHVMFKGTKKRSAFEISDHIDRVGAQINAFTSKEMTCYYTKSTSDRLDVCLDILSDIFFDSVYDEK